MTQNEIEELAERKLRETKTYSVPVPIDILAHRLSLTLQSDELGDKASGLLVVKNNRGTIGYNSDHAPVRQRFTIAHEIAHFLAHVKSSRSTLFLDKSIVAYRDEESSTGNDRREVEANRLGAALLMPKTLVREEITKNKLDLETDEALMFLAKRFRVSALAMSNRLTTLGYLRYDDRRSL